MKVSTIQTAFASGTLDELARGRSETALYRNGAASLLNCRMLMAGGAVSRWGTRFLNLLPGAAVVARFEFSRAQAYIAVFLAGAVQFYDAETGAPTGSISGAPWTGDQLTALRFDGAGDTLFVAHPDIETRVIRRTGYASWSMGTLAFDTLRGRPTWRYAPSFVEATAHDGTPNRLTFSGGVIAPDHFGRVFRVYDTADSVWRYAYCNAVLGDDEISVEWDSGGAPEDGTVMVSWEEEAFSPVRGWARSVCLHGQRLVLGGTRDAGDALFLSRAGQFFNFDLGEAKAPDAISASVAGTAIRTITHVVSAQYLTIFTEAATYFVQEATETPITPTSFNVRRLAPFGVRDVRPGELDGGLLMVQTPNSTVRDIAYAEDSTVNIQAVPLSAPVSRLLGEVVSAAYLSDGIDGPEQYGFFVNAAGSLWVLHSARQQRIAAWAEWTTPNGAFTSVAVSGGRVFAVVRRNGAYYLERFDSAVPFDSTVPLTFDLLADPPIPVAHLPAGWAVHGVAVGGDGRMDYLGVGAIASGRVRLTRQQGEMPDYGTGTRWLGLAFPWQIVPLAPALDLADGTLMARTQRLVRTRLLLSGAYSARIGDASLTLLADGMGIGTVPAPASRWWAARHLGWSRANDPRLVPPITRDTPLPVGVLAMVREIAL